MSKRERKLSGIMLILGVFKKDNNYIIFAILLMSLK